MSQYGNSSWQSTRGPGVYSQVPCNLRSRPWLDQGIVDNEPALRRSARGSVLIRFFTSARGRWGAAWVTRAISSSPLVSPRPLSPCVLQSSKRDTRKQQPDHIDVSAVVLGQCGGECLEQNPSSRGGCGRWPDETPRVFGTAQYWGVAAIQTEEQIGGDISWLPTHQAGQALKVMHEFIAFAGRQTKDVNEVKQSIRERKT